MIGRKDPKLRDVRSPEEKQEQFEQLRAVIGWEWDCLRGMSHGDETRIDLIADSLLDFFDVKLLPGANVEGLREREEPDA